MQIQIKSWLTGGVLFECEAGSLSLAIRMAIDKGVSLAYADLQDANLQDANLQDANLRAANLRAADLRAANLQDADLQDADLQDADLQDADLQDADLQDANLQDANLQDANLQDANLQDANLTPVRDDFWAVLSAAPVEVPALIEALNEGRVDGSAYTGECACLVGTIANARHCDINELGPLRPNSSRPAERFFLAIKRGDTPETSQHAKIARDWALEWLGRMRSAFGNAVQPSLVAAEVSPTI